MIIPYPVLAGGRIFYLLHYAKSYSYIFDESNADPTGFYACSGSK